MNKTMKSCRIVSKNCRCFLQCPIPNHFIIQVIFSSASLIAMVRNPERPGISELSTWFPDSLVAAFGPVSSFGPAESAARCRGRRNAPAVAGRPSEAEVSVLSRWIVNKFYNIWDRRFKGPMCIFHIWRCIHHAENCTIRERKPFTCYMHASVSLEWQVRTIANE